VFGCHPGADQRVHRGHILGQCQCQPVVWLCHPVLVVFIEAHRGHPRIQLISTGQVVARKSQFMKELLRSTNPVKLALTTALLEGEGIAVFQMDVHMSVLEGSIGILPRRLMVRDSVSFSWSRAVLRDNAIEVE